MRYKPWDHCRKNPWTDNGFFLPCFIPAYPHEFTKESNWFLKYISYGMIFNNFFLELYAQKWLKNKQNILQKVTKFILKKNNSVCIYKYKIKLKSRKLEWCTTIDHGTCVDDCLCTYGGCKQTPPHPFSHSEYLYYRRAWLKIITCRYTFTLGINRTLILLKQFIPG